MPIKGASTARYAQTSHHFRAARLHHPEGGGKMAARLCMRAARFLFAIASTAVSKLARSFVRVFLSMRYCTNSAVRPL